jgi:myo-inositol-1(or 4)-monophosphatase
MAAGMLLVREAGGYLSDADGGDAMFKSRSICAGNEAMHRHLLQLLRKA